MPVSPITDIKSEVGRFGFAIVENILSPREVDVLLQSLEQISDSTAVRKRGTVFAVRNLLDISPEIRRLASSK